MQRRRDETKLLESGVGQTQKDRSGGRRIIKRSCFGFCAQLLWDGPPRVCSKSVPLILTGTACFTTKNSAIVTYVALATGSSTLCNAFSLCSKNDLSVEEQACTGCVDIFRSGASGMMQQFAPVPISLAPGPSDIYSSQPRVMLIKCVDL